LKAGNGRYLWIYWQKNWVINKYRNILCHRTFYYGKKIMIEILSEKREIYEK
jgi:hypothetical protein